jgi:uncharacterized membrane protein
MSKLGNTFWIMSALFVLNMALCFYDLTWYNMSAGLFAGLVALIILITKKSITSEYNK